MIGIVQTLCQWFCRNGSAPPARRPRTHRGPTPRPKGNCSIPPNRRRPRKYARIAGVAMAHHDFAGHGRVPRGSRARTPPGRVTGSVVKSNFMSTRAAARYSTVANPWFEGSREPDLGGELGRHRLARSCNARAKRDKQLGRAASSHSAGKGTPRSSRTNAGAGQRRETHVGIQACAAHGRIRWKQRHRIVPADERGNRRRHL